MEPHLDDDWKSEELDKRKKRNQRISWGLIFCVLIWAFFMNGQIMFWEFSGKLGLIPQDEVGYLIDNMEYYYLYSDVFETSEYQVLKEKMLHRNWVSSGTFEKFIYDVSQLVGDEYSYFYFDSFLDFRSDYTHIVEDNDDGFEYDVTDEGIGHIKFNEFLEGTAMRFDEAIKAMKQQNIKQIIIDLRGNPGGLLYECNDIADALLPKTEIISQFYNDGSMYIYYSDPEYTDFEKISVFLDEESASCSEMLALTLKTNLGDEVEVIGKHTVGKEVTQSVVESDTFSYALFIVTSRWSVKGQTVKELNDLLNAYDHKELDDFEDFYQYAID